MANRNTKLIIKNSNVVNRPLPSELLAGEAIVNTAEGIMFLSGVTSSTNEWTPAGTGSGANFFEVGSNLFQLKLRDKITKYQGIEGAGLAGKFLSGTTDGFVLADINTVQGIDSYVVGGTYDSNTDEITLTLNEGKPDVVIGGISDTFTTGGTLSGTDLVITLNDGTEVTVDLSNLDTQDTYVTGGTVTSFPNSTTPVGEITLGYNNDDGNTYTLPFNDTFVTGGTLSGTDLVIDFNDGTDVNIDLSALDSVDTFVTGFTYSNNVFTIDQNNGQASLSVTLDSVTGLTIDSLTPGRVVYVGSGGELKDEGGFEYNETSDTLLAGNINTSATGSAFVGTGGLIVGSGGDVDTPGNGDVVIHGNLTIFGDAITAATSELYVEDNNITLNYNPDSDTSATSIGAGFTIQDGDGNNGDVNFDLRSMNGFTGIVVGEDPDITEYTGPTGVENRAFVTQLNDIVIRSTDVTTPNGVRLLAEFDVLDGGTY